MANGASIPGGVGHDLSLSAQAGYLLEWLDTLDLPERPILVGHDLGGGVAQIAAVRAPEAFSGLVLTNAVCYDSWPIPSVKVMQRLAPGLALLPEVLMYPSFVQLLRRGHDDQQRARESIGVHWGSYVTHGAARGLMRQMSALDVADTLRPCLAGDAAARRRPVRFGAKARPADRSLGSALLGALRRAIDSGVRHPWGTPGRWGTHEPRVSVWMDPRWVCVSP